MNDYLITIRQYREIAPEHGQVALDELAAHAKHMVEQRGSRARRS